MVLLESPTNPLLKIADLATIAAQVKQRAPNALVVVDNTMMSPYLQRPLEYGADIVYDSATKYLSGHHDLMAGVVTCNDDNLAKVRPHDLMLCLMDLSTYMLAANRIYN
jgi:cystathionine beta-lyase/cystathionine gamma-synthase